MEWLREWSGPIAGLLSIGAMIYTWLMARSKVNEEKLSEHDKNLKDHDRRIQAVESEMKHLPSKDDVQDLRIALTEVKGALGRLEESNSGVGRAVRRIEGYLFKGES